MSELEIRYYKGKYPVEVLKKSKGNWLVKALEEIELPIIPIMYYNYNIDPHTIHVNEEFVTVPRLLWKNKKQ